jgi:hypothetical protein
MLITGIASNSPVPGAGSIDQEMTFIYEHHRKELAMQGLFEFLFGIDISPEQYTVLHYDHLFDIPSDTGTPSTIGLVALQKARTVNAASKREAFSFANTGYIFTRSCETAPSNYVLLWLPETELFVRETKIELTIEDGKLALI